MRFEAKKEGAFILPLVIPTSIAFLVALWFVFSRSSAVAGVVLVLTLALFYGIYYFWTHTYYEVKKEQLFYRSISVKGQIPIRKINRIEAGNYPTSGSPALAFTGLMIHYSGGKELFIAPADSERLVKELKVVNRRIKVEM
jgi:hypothetical protein